MLWMTLKMMTIFLSGFGFGLGLGCVILVRCTEDAAGAAGSMKQGQVW
jgi:hypothetical protein